MTNTLTDNDVFIAIPVYNGEAFIRKAVRSVLNQTWPRWRLVVLDDGSTDGSLNAVRQEAGGDPRVSIISDGLNKGLAQRLNESVDMARGKYYVRMDADDIMHPQRLERQLTVLEEHPEIDVLGTAAYLIDDNDNILGERRLAGDGGMSRTTVFIHPSIIGKTAWFKANRYDPEATRMEDFELWRRTAAKSDFRCLDEPLLYYREYGVPIIGKYISTSWNIIKRVGLHPRRYNMTLPQSAKLVASHVTKIIIAASLQLINKPEFLLRFRKNLQVSKITIANESLKMALEVQYNTIYPSTI